jgi:DNA-binding NarL/FixJ family response regulator
MLIGERSDLAPTVTIRVMHCDDSESFTSLVRHWLDEHPDIEWAGAERDPARVGDSVAATQPDVVLLDTMGQPGDGELIAAVRRAAPEARVIVYSGYVDLMGTEGLAGGADAYLDKARDEQALVACVRAVVSSQ